MDELSTFCNELKKIIGESNNLDIESIIEYEDNRYVNLYAKTKIIKIINMYRL